MTPIEISRSETDRTDRRRGYAFAVISAFSSATATVIGKWNLAYIQPLQMNSAIFTVASLALGLFVIPARGIRAVVSHTPRVWLWIVLFSLGSWFAIWAFWAGVQRMDPSLAAFLNRIEVIVSILLGMIYLGERFTRAETAGALLSIAGLVVMRITLRMEYSEGFWLVLLGSVLFGTTEFISKIAVKYVEPPILAFVRNSFLAIMYLAVVIAGGMSYRGMNEVWIGVIALGFVGPIFARMVYLIALKKVELSKVAIISQLQPVFVLLIALTFLSQIPTLRELIGGILLASGCLVMVTARRIRIRTKL
jgi:drug/metabolite transporter (DMT)-like permease